MRSAYFSPLLCNKQKSGLLDFGHNAYFIDASILGCILTPRAAAKNACAKSDELLNDLVGRLFSLALLKKRFQKRTNPAGGIGISGSRLRIVIWTSCFKVPGSDAGWRD